MPDKEKIKFRKKILGNHKNDNIKVNWIESTQSVLNKLFIDDFAITADLVKNQIEMNKN